MQRVKHLSFFGSDSDSLPFDSYNSLIPMPLLETLSFYYLYELPNLLSFLEQYKDRNQFATISFIACEIECLQETIGFDSQDPDHLTFFKKYKNIFELLLPSQPNNLQTLKFIDSDFSPTIDNVKCEEANEAIGDIQRIKSSLSKLKGLVYVSENMDSSNVFYNLSRSILSRLSSFKQLESIHTHNSKDDALLPSYLRRNNANALHQVTELCISVSLGEDLLPNLYTLVPNLEKLCLVIDVSDPKKVSISAFEAIFRNILIYLFKLKLFQIVFLMQTGFDDKDSRFCIERMKIIHQFCKIMTEVIVHLRSVSFCRLRSIQPLLFRLHVKSYHIGRDRKCRMRTPDDAGHIQTGELAEIINQLIPVFDYLSPRKDAIQMDV